MDSASSPSVAGDHSRHRRSYTDSRSKPSGRLRRAAAWLAAGLSTLAAARAHAAAFDLADTSWEGTSEFLALARDELGAERVRVVASLDFDALSPKDAVLLLHPEVNLDEDSLGAFLASGGRVAVLDDHGTSPSLLERYRIRRVPAPLRPTQALRDNPSLAFAAPAVQSVAGQEQNRHPVVANVDRLVTNHPTALLHPDLTPVLTISALGEPHATLAVTGVIAGRGRLFAMADPSTLINLMLRYPGNRAFGRGLVRYLVEDDGWGRREGRLFVLANRFAQVGHYGTRDGVRGRVAEFLDDAGSALAEWHESGLPAPLARALGGLAGLAVLGWAGYFALRRHRPTRPRYASAAPLVAQGGLPGRAAVLTAPTTDRALLLAEFEGLLREELAGRAGLPPTSTPERSLAVLEERRGRPFAAEARALLRQAQEASQALLGGPNRRTNLGQVADYERRLARLLADIDAPSKSAPAGQ